MYAENLKRFHGNYEKDKINNKIIENSPRRDSSGSSDNENICNRESVKKSIKYYLQNTTLHGLKYIAEERITIPERVFFGLSFIVVIMLSGVFISDIYTKWSASPIIITTSAKQAYISGVPFPAITICNLNLALKSKVMKIEKFSGNFSLLMSLCDQNSNVSQSYIGTWRYFKQLLIEVAQPCRRMILYCSFGNQQEECSKLFNSELTDEGLCCTFNSLDQIFLLKNYSDENRLSPIFENHYKPIDWTPEKGYTTDLPEFYYPRIGGGVGTRMGLTVILNASMSEYFCSKTTSYGFKVLVHNPAEQPKISNYGFLVTAGREARIPLEPIYQDAVPSIRSIKKETRRCLFSDEGDLRYYRIYSRTNCELECEARIVQEQCGCLLYYLPKIDSNVRICGPNDNNCTNRVQAAIEATSSNISCNECWPGCFELTFRASLTSTTIVAGTFLSNDIYPNDIFDAKNDIKEISILHFYYLNSIFRSTTKSEVFGFTEFLSNTGGLLGLFMGFSIFSLIEIIYYVTVRPYCANRTLELKHRKKNEQAKNLQYPAPLKRPSYKKELNVEAWHMGGGKSKQKFEDKKYFKNSWRNVLQSFRTSDDIEPQWPYLN